MGKVQRLTGSSPCTRRRNVETGSILLFLYLNRYKRQEDKDIVFKITLRYIAKHLNAGVKKCDLPKRTLFSAVQDSHSISIVGAQPPLVRTGYEGVMAHRVDKKFAWVARDNGKVTEVSDKHIAILYDNGKEVRVNIGDIYGVSTGTVIKNRLITDYSVGQVVKQGDVVCYNPYHFSRDIFNKSQVLFKNSTLARVTFMESNDTEEDSSAISERLSDQMVTTTTEVRTLVIPFTDRVEKLVMVGDVVESDSNLCTIINAVFSDNTMFGQHELETLEELAQTSPKAKHAGVVNKMEVFYYGDPSVAEVSDSVKAVMKRYDYERKQLALKMKDGRPESGQLLETMRIDGNPLPLNHIAIKVYIENQDGMEIGDKLVVKK